MGPLEVFIFLLVWILPSFAIAKLAEQRGRDFWFYLGLGLLISWLISLATILVLGRREPSPPDPTARIAPSGEADLR